MNLDGLSMRPLVQELKNFLVGGRIDKIFQHNKVIFTFTIRQPGQTFLLKISVAPQNPSVFITENSLENLPEPPTFCMVLRKNLENGRISDIRQFQLDRIIFFDIDTIGAGGKIQTLTLSVELIGKYSNLILLHEDKIIDALKKIGSNSSRVRTVLPNQIYQLPPAQNKFNIFSVNLDEVSKTLQPDKSVMNFFQGFGPQTTQEIIFQSQSIGLNNALKKIRQNIENPTPCFIENSGKILAVSAVDLNYLQGNKKFFSSISKMLDVADKIAEIYIPPDKEKFLKLIHNELKRATNKISVLESELANAENADNWKIFADNLSTYRYQFKDHADDEITVANIYSEIGEEIKIPLDKKISVSANVQNFYKKYDKLKRSKNFITEQIEQCHAEIFYLESVEHSLTSSETLAEIDEIRTELINGGYLKEFRKKSASSKKSEPFKFFAPDGTEILIGKNNSQNDKLTFKIAEPNDIWLHTKEITGSHVIIRCNGIFPADETLIFAAKLAVKFSKAAGSSKVPVDYTFCKFVKKPSGAKPGFVIFTNQKTLYVNDDENLKVASAAS